MIVSFARRCTINPFPLSLIPLLPSQKRLRRFRERPEEKGENSWRLPQKSNRKGAGKETILQRRTRTGRQLGYCKVTEDCLVLPRPLFWSTGTWKPATVDTGNAFSRKTCARRWILRTEQKSAWFFTSYKYHQGGLDDAEYESDTKTLFVPESESCPEKKVQELLGPSQPNVRCFVSETMRLSKREVQSHRRQNLVLQRTSCHNYAR